jgi:hypothetical protein
MNAIKRTAATTPETIPIIKVVDYDSYKDEGSS